jgi:hypothetical protein
MKSKNENLKPIPAFKPDLPVYHVEWFSSMLPQPAGTCKFYFLLVRSFKYIKTYPHFIVMVIDVKNRNLHITYRDNRKFNKINRKIMLKLLLTQFE